MTAEHVSARRTGRGYNEQIHEILALFLSFLPITNDGKRRQTMTGKEGGKERERKLEHLTRKKLKWPCFGVALVGWLGPREISGSPSGENTRSSSRVYIPARTICGRYPRIQGDNEGKKNSLVNTEHVFVFERSTSRRRLDGRDVKFPVGISKEEKLKSWYARIPF